MTNLVIDGVKLGEHDSIDQAGLVGHGVVRQGLVKLNLRMWAGEEWQNVGSYSSTRQEEHSRRTRSNVIVSLCDFRTFDEIMKLSPNCFFVKPSL